MADSSGRITVTIHQQSISETGYSNHIKSTFAHEFGHAMGVGDAYNAWYRTHEAKVPRRPVDGKTGYWAPVEYIEQESGNKWTVQVPDDDIMLGRGTNHVNHVTPNNIRMVLEAYRKNRPVFYPGSSKLFANRGTDPIIY